MDLPIVRQNTRKIPEKLLVTGLIRARPINIYKVDRFVGLKTNSVIAVVGYNVPDG